MKKIMAALFLVSTMVALGTQEDVTTIGKEVQGVNKEQLEMKEIETNDVLLKNQNIQSGAIKVTNDNFQNQNQKIKVVQGQKNALEKELSQGVEEKSFIKYIIGGIAVVALIIAL
ncbi:hypothetical protein IX317_000331 [Fusobacterium sp. DD29]|uniref:hypothetical protein n=1 Tax=unclassified Fusobacterium TaxID=2648384 RepID=UPI001B8C8748|nr:MULTISPECIES: hypothetical protein [unclassified Fusobacterium]MBR8700732.1 hypothetical protein [Fusobacterium sp. DD45]MBR8710428.1 hypothetical protein [Fusobacterium sp. DD28]MBR8748672.1 hypothetical protein [Fusobacterium sp. DD29]MBR8751022.1 hypothetical protein [Fusobacterium sp. DD26]MBR8760976.1 hypothetical protein [Fusobacterium sp. DD25]